MFILAMHYVPTFTDPEMDQLSRRSQRAEAVYQTYLRNFIMPVVELLSQDTTAPSYTPDPATIKDPKTVKTESPNRITRTEAIHWNRATIERFGGTFLGVDNLRPENTLDYALAIPGAECWGQRLYETLPEEAAAMTRTIANGHCFNDGNKRTAGRILLEFLWRNNYMLVCDAKDLEQAILSLVCHTMDVCEFAAWLNSVMEEIS